VSPQNGVSYITDHLHRHDNAFVSWLVALVRVLILKVGTIGVVQSGEEDEGNNDNVSHVCKLCEPD
jgi:hypothetical protein